MILGIQNRSGLVSRHTTATGVVEKKKAIVGKTRITRSPLPCITFFGLRERHHFHLVDNSSLPILTAASAFLLVGSFVLCFHPSPIPVGSFDLGNIIFSMAIVSFSTSLLVWFYTVLAESNAGYHLPRVRLGLRYGFALFIVSEIMFFFAFF